jgi:hypothetical protein
MEALIEIRLIFPEEMKLFLPKRLVAAFAQAVDPENFSATITEAIEDQLKKTRFRNALQKARGNTA